MAGPPGLERCPDSGLALAAASHTSPDGQDPFWATGRWHGREPGARGAHCLQGSLPASLASRGLPHPGPSGTSLAGLLSFPSPGLDLHASSPFHFFPLPLKARVSASKFWALLPQIVQKSRQSPKSSKGPSALQ